MAMEINLSEYLVVPDRDGTPLLEGNNLAIQHMTTGNIICVPLDQVAGHFGLVRIGDDEFGDTIVQTAQPSSSQTESKELRQWTIAETKYMLNLYGDCVTQVGPLKKYRTKRQMWEDMARHIADYFTTTLTASQVENRYKHVLKGNKKRVQHNNVSGNNRITTTYDDEFDKLAGMDDTINPYLLTQSETIAGGKNSDTPPADTPPDPPSPPAPPAKEKKTKKKPQTKDSLVNVYKDYCEERKLERKENREEKVTRKEAKEILKEKRFQEAENRRQIRHGEKMDLLNRIANALTNNN